MPLYQVIYNNPLFASPRKVVPQTGTSRVPSKVLGAKNVASRVRTTLDAINALLSTHFHGALPDNSIISDIVNALPQLSNLGTVLEALAALPPECRPRWCKNHGGPVRTWTGDLQGLGVVVPRPPAPPPVGATPFPAQALDHLVAALRRETGIGLLALSKLNLVDDYLPRGIERPQKLAVTLLPFRLLYPGPSGWPTVTLPLPGLREFRDLDDRIDNLLEIIEMAPRTVFRPTIRSRVAAAPPPGLGVWNPLAGASTPMTLPQPPAAEPAGSPSPAPPKGPWLEVDVVEKVATLDGVRYSLLEAGAAVLDILLNAKGEWVSLSNYTSKSRPLLGGHPTREIKKLPIQIRTLVQSEPGKGTRLIRPMVS